MNWQNHFSILATFALGGCMPGEHTKVVTSEAYTQPACWFDKDGTLSSYLVFGLRGREAVPYLISKKCVVVDGGLDPGIGVINNLVSIIILDEDHNLQQKFPDWRVSDAIKTDQPLPTGSSRMYAISAEVEPKTHAYKKNVVSLRKLIALQDSGRDFETFLEEISDE